MVSWALRILAITVLSGALIACGPEASRTRGGGPGADIGNRGSEIQLHPFGPKVIYSNTPKEGEASQVAGMPVE
ncbi:hypothetical protein OO015_10770 [Thermomicrobium sp. 4228-Ro]|uniref:hypothetical protein n=1 Tax=Thermomicrobium sp. 4228-Ro TaxID=2993937 RepID=UPI002248D416|nr:hypothetical protein [Thermomicrobium sp. 4228-Ro]MCX2727972.1 hypothetical protein [Thermomicrobium sp. 4228-Ro]